MNNSCYPSRLVKSTWGDDYDIALYGRLGLHCHNFQKVSFSCLFFFPLLCKILLLLGK